MLNHIPFEFMDLKSLLSFEFCLNHGFEFDPGLLIGFESDLDHLACLFGKSLFWSTVLLSSNISFYKQLMVF
jgi:hypothetical protein